MTQTQSSQRRLDDQVVKMRSTRASRYHMRCQRTCTPYSSRINPRFGYLTSTNCVPLMSDDKATSDLNHSRSRSSSRRNDLFQDDHKKGNQPQTHLETTGNLDAEILVIHGGSRLRFLTVRSVISLPPPI